MPLRNWLLLPTLKRRQIVTSQSQASYSCYNALWYCWAYLVIDDRNRLGKEKTASRRRNIYCIRCLPEFHRKALDTTSDF